MKSLEKILKPARFILIIVALSFAYFLSIKVTQFDPVKLIVSAPKAKTILGQFAKPDIFTSSSETVIYEYDFPVPCGAAEPSEHATSGPRIEADVDCGEPGQKFIIYGKELDENIDVALWWIFPDGNKLSAGRFTTDKKGEFTKEIEVRPILITKEGVPAKLQAEVSLREAKIMLTSTVKEVVDSLVVTIFMALLATTIGTIFAIPLSFLAASNITRHGVIGNAIYYITRSFLNLIRAYEPLVMQHLCFNCWIWDTIRWYSCFGFGYNRITGENVLRISRKY